jgi:hypothetical protein
MRVITEMLMKLKYRGMLEEFEAQLRSTEYDSMSFSGRFSLLVEAEYPRKQNGKIQLRHKKAAFAQRDACIEGSIIRLTEILTKTLYLSWPVAHMLSVTKTY